MQLSAWRSRQLGIAAIAMVAVTAFGFVVMRAQTPLHAAQSESALLLEKRGSGLISELPGSECDADALCSLLQNKETIAAVIAPQAVQPFVSASPARKTAINENSFPCTAIGSNPKVGATYLPCCPGTSVKESGGLVKTHACAPDPPGDVLECVSLEAVPLTHRCDLTSVTGATSCPLSKMLPEAGQPGGRFLVYPGGSTSCIFPPTLTGYGECSSSVKGSNRLSFDVVPSNPKQLLIYFQGGGACWDALTTGGVTTACTTQSKPNMPHGMLDPTASSNRYAHYTVIQVHYCSGDAHVGNSTHAYGNGEFPNQGCVQRGYRNFKAVLAWIKAQPEFSKLDDLVIAGSSAGSIGAQAWSRHLLAELGSRTLRTATIYDSFMGVFPMEKNGGSVSGKILKTQFQVCDLPEILPDASQRAKCANAQLLLPDLVVPTLVAFPETDFTIVNSKQDYVQRLFYDMTGLTYLVKPFNWAQNTIAGREFLYNQSLFYLEQYVRANPTHVHAMIVNGDCHTFAELPDWLEATSVGPGNPRGEKCPTPGASAKETAKQEKAIMGTTLNCCSHPGRAAVVNGQQMLGYLPMAIWDAVPLVPVKDANPAAVPPMIASLKDNCYGPLDNLDIGDDLLYSCPPFLQYVGGVQP